MAEDLLEDPSDTPASNDGNQKFPIPFGRFAAMLRGTADEVWTTHMKRNHGRENHYIEEWQALIEKYRHEPAHPSVLGH